MMNDKSVTQAQVPWAKLLYFRPDKGWMFSTRCIQNTNSMITIYLFLFIQGPFCLSPFFPPSFSLFVST